MHYFVRIFSAPKDSLNMEKKKIPKANYIFNVFVEIDILRNFSKMCTGASEFLVVTVRKKEVVLLRCVEETKFY